MSWFFHLHRTVNPIHQHDTVETLCNMTLKDVDLIWFGGLGEELEPSNSQRLCPRCRKVMVGVERQYEFGVIEFQDGRQIAVSGA